jgi:hypothetical protein
MRKGFLIYEEVRKYLVIYEEAVSHITLQLVAQCTGTGGAVYTGTGGAVCKGATPSVEQ